MFSISRLGKNVWLHRPSLFSPIPTLPRLLLICQHRRWHSWMLCMVSERAQTVLPWVETLAFANRSVCAQGRDALQNRMLFCVMKSRGKMALKCMITHIHYAHAYAQLLVHCALCTAFSWRAISLTWVVNINSVCTDAAFKVQNSSYNHQWQLTWAL